MSGAPAAPGAWPANAGVALRRTTKSAKVVDFILLILLHRHAGHGRGGWSAAAPVPALTSWRRFPAADRRLFPARYGAIGGSCRSAIRPLPCRWRLGDEGSSWR